MSETMATAIGLSFALVMLFVLWLKFHEHLQLHRHEHGPHSHRTDLKQILYHLNDSGMMRRRPKGEHRSSWSRIED